MKKWILGILALFVGIAVYALWWAGSPKGPALEQVAYLKEPRITAMEPRRVLQVTATGDPNETAPHALGLLLDAYFSVEGVPKRGAAMPAPRARWPKPFETPRDQWVGHYAMPVPVNAALPNPLPSKNGLEVQEAMWEYGQVAEILHVGPYSAEGRTVDRLHAFIADEGYSFLPPHEEEYLRGPGMWFKGNSEEYLTVIRFRVRPANLPDSIPAAEADSVPSMADSAAMPAG